MIDEQEPDSSYGISWIVWYRKKTGLGLAEAREAYIKKFGRDVYNEIQKTRLKIFVSGKITEENQVRTLMDALIAVGHTITFDWTTLPHYKPYEENKFESSHAATLECNGVKSADVLIMLLHDNGVGMFVELGIALGRGIPVWAVTDKPVRSMFLMHPLVKIVPTVEDVLNEFK